MRKKDFKGRCVKKNLSKCKVVCKTYDKIQTAYADMLQADNDIKEIRCNVLLDNTDYTSDFVCVGSVYNEWYKKQKTVFVGYGRHNLS